MRTRIKNLTFVLLLMAAGSLVGRAATITHNIATGSLIIAGTSTDDYIITGTTNIYNVLVNAGYKGTITLSNLSITSFSGNPPISVRGQNNCSNLTPITNVDIILDGNNVLTSSSSYMALASCAIHVSQGAQINISAINPLDNASGKLTATVTDQNGGAGIGAMNRATNTNEDTASAAITGGCEANFGGISTPTAGGNVVISSGTITAQGGHGAGIGGGFMSYYDGMIVIYGGIVTTSALHHAAGIGSGCPDGVGVKDTCFTSNSAIVVLPPAQISATGASGSGTDPNLGLAGAKNIIYIGDTAKSLVTVRTIDYEPYADIYADLSQNVILASVINTVVPPSKFDINKVKFGQTDGSGIFQFNGILNDSTTFFTDAVSSNPPTLGKPYMPEVVRLPAGGTVILKLMVINLSLKSFPSIPLIEGVRYFGGTYKGFPPQNYVFR